ncbi:MAG: hypothetical protein ACFFCM_13635 [Promethearchaeota archaeon]
MKPQERLLKIATSIVVTTVIFVLVVTILGVGNSNNLSENNRQLPNMGLPIVSEPNFTVDFGSGNKISETCLMDKFSVSKNNDVSVAECAADFCIDTEPGVMVVSYTIPDVLPLCITEEYIDSNFDITVASYGGYHPDEQGMNYMNIMQPKTGLGGCVGIEWVYLGSFLCDNPDMICYGCYVDVYAADFVLADPIQIDSNHLPVVFTQGADWDTICDGLPSDNLNKWVFVCLSTAWEGCHENDQKFKLILAHKNYFPEIPSSVYKIHRQLDFFYYYKKNPFIFFSFLNS